MPPFLRYLLVLLIPVTAISQDRDEELVSWNANSKLTWNDYKARPTPGSDAAAITTTYLAIEYSINRYGLSYRIQCRFSKDRSWGLHKTEYILTHEQGHFDIAEIFARKLHKEMGEYRFNKKTYEKDLKEIYQRVMDEKEQMQEAYDRETNHSINKKKQAEWLTLIEQMLEKYREYANYQ